jgi:Flp pilus assembly secretin CpaC
MVTAKLQERRSFGLGEARGMERIMNYSIENFGRALITIAAMSFVLIATSFGAKAGEIRVPLNESIVHVFDQDVATVAVANPAIADVTVHNGRVLLVVGRSFGSTNVVVLDKDGKALGSERIRVVSVGGHANLTLTKGDQNSIISFSCAPRCERVLVPGDQANNTAEFDKVQKQNSDMSGDAQSASE